MATYGLKTTKLAIK